LNSVDLIRFIDVHQKAVVTFTKTNISNFKYIALSYVWGKSQKLTLKTSNAATLAVPGALQNESLPRSIADALHLTEVLGVGYLWIDALSILQDDPADKKAQIAAMNGIFSASFVTIVAASGDDADGGLPGLRPGTRFLEQEEVVVKLPATQDMGVDDSPAEAGLSLMTTLEPMKFPGLHYLEQTLWNSRGWTMQERVLSRRVLIFTKEQVYWVCQGANFCEESYFEEPILPFNRFHHSALEMTLQRSFRNFYESQDPQVRFWAQYQDLVARFTRRRFTYDGDVYDGFSAILDALSKMSGHEFLWGLPRSRFELGLLWNTFTGQHRRKALSTLPMTSKNFRVPFPSWSWMGWIGESWISVGDVRCELG
jgi:hypothetical protein